jgi:hypothetical protein
MDLSSRLPVTVLSGFLGSGKTTSTGVSEPLPVGCDSTKAQSLGPDISAERGNVPLAEVLATNRFDMDKARTSAGWNSFSSARTYPKPKC